MPIPKEFMIKGGLRESFRGGTSKLAERPCYGFSKDAHGKLVIDNAEAMVIRFIFERYLAGDSLGKIADALAEQKIVSPTGKARWNRQALNKLLSNEKYIGCALLQKTMTEDRRQIRNKGQVSRYLYQNNNPAIIPMEDFKAVQEEKLRRSPTQEQTAMFDWTHSL